MSRGFNLRYARTIGDLGLAIQNTAPLSSGLMVHRVVLAEGNSSHVIDLMSNTLLPIAQCLTKVNTSACVAEEPGYAAGNLP